MAKAKAEEETAYKLARIGAVQGYAQDVGQGTLGALGAYNAQWVAPVTYTSNSMATSYMANTVSES